MLGHEGMPRVRELFIGRNARRVAGFATAIDAAPGAGYANAIQRNDAG